MFRLLKWYLDLVTEDGTVFIGYAARVRLGGVQVGYASALVSPPGARTSEQGATDRSPLPTLGDSTLAWECPTLRLSGTWVAEAPPVQRVLLQGRDGAIQWCCHLPRASATVRLDGAVLSGQGYVESLRLTIPPWRLPFRTLRWGRHVSGGHSAVWIDWAGHSEQRWLWLDGREQPGARLVDLGVTGMDDGTELSLDAGRDVLDRRVLASLTDILPNLLTRMLPRLSAMREHKQLSRSSLVTRGRPVDRGWALHEVVSW